MPRPEAAGRRRLGLPPFPRLARTVTFKLALLQAGLFAVTAAVLFATVYASFVGYARDQLRGAIAAEYDALAEDRSGEGLGDLVALVATRTRGAGAEGFRYLVRAADGARLAGDLPDEGLAAGWQDVRVVRAGTDARAGKQKLEVHAGTLPTGEFVAVGRDVGELSHIKEVVARSFGGAAALTLALALLSGAVTSLGALRRVEAVNGITRGIMEGDLGRRVPERGTGDEFDRLARNTNAMLDRIQLLMEGMRQVSSDIAHDLRTPLTHLRQRLEAARGGPRTVEAYEAAIDAASGDVDTILRVFASLLRIAQVEAGARRGGFAEVDLSEVFAAIVEAYGPVAEDAGQDLDADVEPGLRVHGDRDLLTQMLANLVENAIRYAGPGARIRVSLDRDGPHFVGAVEDSGAGIPEHERARVFGRFVRLDASRPGEGHGLGLALVKAVADLHGIALALSDAGPGLRVTMRGTAVRR
ncbi:sensor histidine kinase [Lichenibacterium dinghuense]|uniref:sensor histidine kinase n=1 Tax=Lichenibacterium dinghuense TaxID=2895977 RepID=UPI001F4582AC|nr:ATP-binding protein [Lichenibacterium sp. 6Y81]